MIYHRLGDSGRLVYISINCDKPLFLIKDLFIKDLFIKDLASKVLFLFSISPWISLALMRLRDSLTSLANPTHILDYGWGQSNDFVDPLSALDPGRFGARL